MYWVKTDESYKYSITMWLHSLIQCNAEHAVQQSYYYHHVYTPAHTLWAVPLPHFWVNHHFDSEDEGSRFLQNTGNYLNVVWT